MRRRCAFMFNLLNQILYTWFYLCFVSIDSYLYSSLWLNWEISSLGYIRQYICIWIFLLPNIRIGIAPPPKISTLVGL